MPVTTSRRASKRSIPGCSNSVASCSRTRGAWVRRSWRTGSTTARQQPVAGDLRFLVAATRILYEIERSGDLAVNGAKGLLRRDGYTLPPQIHSLVARLARGSADLFSDGLEALRSLDAAAAPIIDRADDEIDTVVGELYGVVAKNSEHIGFDLAKELTRIGQIEADV